jgi:hypothetical protein
MVTTNTAAAYRSALDSSRLAGDLDGPRDDASPVTLSDCSSPSLRPFIVSCTFALALPSRPAG